MHSLSGPAGAICRFPELRRCSGRLHIFQQPAGLRKNGLYPVPATRKVAAATQTLLAFARRLTDIIARKPGGEETSMKNPLESLHMTVGLGVVLTVILIIVAQAIGG